MRTILDVLTAQPEFKELKQVIENAGWHHNESVWDHSMKTHESLLAVLDTVTLEVRERLNQPVDADTRLLLLEMSALLHDIGKKDAIGDVTGKSAQIGHEVMGAASADVVLERLGVCRKERDFVCSIVVNHSLFHYALTPGNRLTSNDVKSIRDKFPGIYLELILLGMADTTASRRGIKKSEYNHRIASYRKLLGTIALDPDSHGSSLSKKVQA